MWNWIGWFLEPQELTWEEYRFSLLNIFDFHEITKIPLFSQHLYIAEHSSLEPKALYVLFSVCFELQQHTIAKIL